MNSHFNMHLNDIAAALQLPPLPGNPVLTGISTDSRSVKPGECFVALSGENFDGHDYVARAAERGAAAAVVSRPMPQVAIGQLIVEHPGRAYGRIAQSWRQRFDLPVLALTGSNGKTTVKEMLRAILAKHYGDETAVLATEGNLNNDVGVPQMMLRLNAAHRVAIFELGMNHLGEIAYLTHLLSPAVGLINMAGTAHIGEVGSRELIAEAKGEIFAGLGDAGIAVINMHDRFGAYWKSAAGAHRIVSFGIRDEDDLCARFGEVLTIATQGREIAVRLNVPGKHNQQNALAAAAGAVALGVPLDTIEAGLQDFRGVAGRLKSYRGHNGATIIDDTYNANPDSVKAAIAVLAAFPPPRMLVLGDMKELGSRAAAMHAEVGLAAREAGIESLWAIGEHMQDAVNAFGVGATHFQEIDVLVNALKPQLLPHTHLLVKGSRSMKMERVVAQLATEYQAEPHEC